jgi:hypothetical protein
MVNQDIAESSERDGESFTALRMADGVLRWNHDVNMMI